MALKASLVIILLIILASPAPAGERIWTYANGQTVRAEFISEVDGEVTLLRDGKLVTVKADQLSEADRLVVKELAAGRTVPGELPGTPAENKLAKAADQPSALVPAGEEKPTKGKPIPVVNRVWTDVFGNQTTAKFVRIVGSDVVLMRSTKPITVRFYDLTTTDQEYLKELLTSQGREALIPPPLPMPTEQPQGAAPAVAPAAPPADPVAPAPPSIPQPPDLPTPGSGAARASAIFDEMQKRSAERMAEHRQRSQERMREMHDMVHGRPIAAPAGRVTEDATASSSGTPAPSAEKSSTASVDSQTVAQTRQIVIIGLVVVGVLGTVAVIVFVAITIAAASSASRQRQYR